MRRHRAVLLAAVIAVVSIGGADARRASPVRPGLTALIAEHGRDRGEIRGIAMLDRIPSRSDVNVARGLGLDAQRLGHLPAMLVEGTIGGFRELAVRPGVRDVYADEKLSPLSADSTGAISADDTRALGFTGKDIGIAVVDTGIDARHPDLAARVVRNVLVTKPSRVIPGILVDTRELPYSNTDLGGHGTLVAGAAAADGSANDYLVGVAPGADLIGYGAGDAAGLLVSQVLMAYDDILQTKDEYNIRVINNSFGAGYSLFDPGSPINVATKAAHDAGITVVIAAGNSAAEMTFNGIATPPWVIAVGGSTLPDSLWDGASWGIPFDNTSAMPPGPDGHVHADGDGLGLVHPDVSAPAARVIAPSGIPIGVGLYGPPYELLASQTVSGTSIAAPHVSGLAAVLLQANPALTPDQILEVLEISATPMRDGSEYWRSGYGVVNALGSVELVTRTDFSQQLLDQLHAEAEARVLAARPYRVLRSDHWLHAPSRVNATDTFSLLVGADTEAVHAGIAYPLTDHTAGADSYSWSLRLLDPGGKEVAKSETVTGPDAWNGAAVLHVDLIDAGIAPLPGTWTIEAIGSAAIGVPPRGESYTLSVVQLQRQVPVVTQPTFIPGGEMRFAFAGGSGGLRSPEGCSYDPIEAGGSMTTGAPGPACHAGGFVKDVYALGGRAVFTSEPLAAETSFGGTSALTLTLADETYANSAALPRLLLYDIDAIDEDGDLLIALAADRLSAELGRGPNVVEYEAEFPSVTVPAGARLRLTLRINGLAERFSSGPMRLLWGGDYAATGVSLTTGSIQ